MMLVNGRQQTHIAVADRGLHYGDGLFETIVVRDELPQLWDRHWRRLSQGCRRIGIEGVDPEELRNESLEACADIEQGVLKLIITRGEGGRGYRPAAEHATRIVATYPWPEYPAANWRAGVAVRMCTTRWGRNPALAGMKHLNRLEQVLARREWDDPGIAEGLMFDDLGHVISGTMSNLFTVTAGRLQTPQLKECGVEGVMRGLILDIVRETALPWEETSLTAQGLREANEVFVCNAVIGLWPVRLVEQQAYAIGPVTRWLAERVNASQRSVKHQEK